MPSIIKELLNKFFGNTYSQKVKIEQPTFPHLANDYPLDYDVNDNRFPNGELKLIKSELINSITKDGGIDYNLNLSGVQATNQILEAYLVKRYLDELFPDKKKNLHLSYMPYSRMDRVNDDEQGFTLKYMADFINSMNFDKVYIIEPHSDVTLALVNNSVPIYHFDTNALDIVKSEIGFDEDEDYVVFPDASALKRYQKGYSHKNELFCTKNRNFDTGKIESLNLHGKIPYSREKKRAIIIDDLCSYGGTFIATAKSLKETHGFTEVYVLVAHCEDNVLKGEVTKTKWIDGLYHYGSISKVNEKNIVNIGHLL